ncbi:MAG: hypothetical protein ABI843_09040 [Dokdonella sp.]
MRERLEPTDSVPFIEREEAEPHQMRLRCPLCDGGTAIDHALEPDADVRCSVCGEISEFRQFREASCQDGREEVKEACPEVVFPRDTAKAGK